jgi:hypothetical protein
MTKAFDPRIVRVGLETEDDIIYFEDEDIRIQGQKFAGPTFGFCSVRLSNLTRDLRNYLLTKSSPVLYRNRERAPTFMTVDVGRESYGTFRLFEGNVYTSSVTQPPDIGITFRSLTHNFGTSVIQSNSQTAYADLRTIAQSIADQNGLTLEFKATSKMIKNYSFTGGIAKQVWKLQQVGDIRCTIDNKTLVVIDKNTYRGSEKFRLNINTGMVGVPQASEMGVQVRMLINPSIQILGGVILESQINPSVNGEDYNIAQITYDIANRDNPFFYNLSLSNFIFEQGTI